MRKSVDINVIAREMRFAHSAELGEFWGNCDAATMWSALSARGRAAWRAAAKAGRDIMRGAEPIADVESATAEAIASWLERDAENWPPVSRLAQINAAEAIRAGRWRKSSASSPVAPLITLANLATATPSAERDRVLRDYRASQLPPTYRHAHRFIPGDPAYGWQNQCAHVVHDAPGGAAHCGAMPDDHDPDAPEAPPKPPRGFSTTHTPDGVRLRKA